MSLCQQFHIASGEVSYFPRRHRFSPVFSHRSFLSSSRSSRPIAPPLHLYQLSSSPVRLLSLTIEREESGFLSEKLSKSKSSLPAERDGKSSTSSSENGSIMDTDDDIEDEDASDDESEEEDIDDVLEDLVALEDLVTDDEDEDDDEDDDSKSRGVSSTQSLAGDYDSITADSKGEVYKRVQDLCRRVQREEGYRITARDLATMYDFRIDKFQRLAVEGFLKGSSVVVCAPTSSGKTLIAECAAAAALALQRRIFYTTPLKALSNQKLREFRDMFGEENVGLITGDAAVNRDAPILIMTTEILRNMLYRR